MNGQFSIEGFLVRAVYTPREVNYEIIDHQGYVCRLVPGYGSFELSKLDRCLGLEVPERTINLLTEHILNRDA